jgi:hypothetical protein
MNLWLDFWTAWLLLAGVAFAAITAIVAVKGFKDLRSMFAGLREGESKRL